MVVRRPNLSTNIPDTGEKRKVVPIVSDPTSAVETKNYSKLILVIFLNINKITKICCNLLVTTRLLIRNNTKFRVYKLFSYQLQVKDEFLSILRRMQFNFEIIIGANVNDLICIELSIKVS